MNTITYNEGHSSSLKVKCKRKLIISKHSSNKLFTFSLLVQMFKISTLNMDTLPKTLHNLKSDLLRSENFSQYTRTSSVPVRLKRFGIEFSQFAPDNVLDYMCIIKVTLQFQ